MEIFLRYTKPKKDNTVVLISSLHENVLIKNGPNSKPNNVISYKQTKFGVNSVD